MQHLVEHLKTRKYTQNQPLQAALIGVDKSHLFPGYITFAEVYYDGEDIDESKVRAKSFFKSLKEEFQVLNNIEWLNPNPDYVLRLKKFLRQCRADGVKAESFAAFGPTKDYLQIIINSYCCGTTVEEGELLLERAIASDIPSISMQQLAGRLAESSMINGFQNEELVALSRALAETRSPIEEDTKIAGEVLVTFETPSPRILQYIQNSLPQRDLWLEAFVRAYFHRYNIRLLVADENEPALLLKTIYFPEDADLMLSDWKIEPTGGTLQLTVQPQGLEFNEYYTIDSSTKIKVQIKELNNSNKKPFARDEHKAMLFLHQFSKSQSYLDNLAVDEAFKEIRNFYSGEIVLQKVHEFFARLTTAGIDPDKGMLLHGPPGTGKTTLVTSLAQWAGMELVCNPTSPGEFGRPLQGQSQQVLIKILNRVKSAPWLPFVMVIDEIDTLAPSRKSKDTSESKTDLLNVILTVFGGARSDEFSNFFIFGCTNRLSQMEEAFLRRMGAKTYVGKMSPEERRKFLAKKLPKCFPSEEMLDLAVSVSTNFSGDNLKKFCERLKMASLRAGKFDVKTNEHKHRFSRKEILDAALRVCQLEHVKIGHTYLPDAIEVGLEDPHMLTAVLAHIGPATCTGRMFADLSGHQPVLLIEQNNAVVPIKLTNANGNENALVRMNKAMDMLINLLTQICIKRKIHFFQVLQSELLQETNVFSEEDAQKFIFDINKECLEYPSSIAVFDLDDLVSIQKNESNPEQQQGNGGIYSVSYQIGKPRLLDMIFSTVNNPPKMKTEEHWTVVVCRHPHLAKIFRETCFWPDTVEEARERSKAKSQTTEVKCAKCGEHYIPAKSTGWDCMSHTEGLIDPDTNQKYNSLAHAKTAPVKEQQRMIWTCCFSPIMGKCTQGSQHQPV